MGQERYCDRNGALSHVMLPSQSIHDGLEQRRFTSQVAAVFAIDPVGMLTFFPFTLSVVRVFETAGGVS